MLLRFFTSTFHTLQTIHQFFYCIVLQTSFCGLERHISLRSWMQFSCFINYHLSSVLQHITFPAPFSFQWYFLLKTLHQSKKHRNQVLQTRHDKKTIVHSVIIHCDFGESSPRSLYEGLPGLFSSWQKSFIHIPIWCKNTCRLLEVRFLLYPVNQNLKSLKVFYCI